MPSEACRDGVGFRQRAHSSPGRRAAVVGSSLPAAGARNDRSVTEAGFEGSGAIVKADDSAGLVVASYNVHRCVGQDGQCDPDRTAVVIRELGADVVALQGVESRAHLDDGVDQFELLGYLTHCETVAGPTLRDHRGHYGNALLTRLPVRRVRRVDLSMPGREPRGALDVELEGGEGPLRVVATHLGSGRRERHIQIDKIVEMLSKEPFAPTVLLGDMNAWLPFADGLAPLNRYFGGAPRARTFPSRLPIFPQDRIWARPSEILGNLQAYRSFVTRMASDHLPVRAELRLRSSEYRITYI